MHYINSDPIIYIGTKMNTENEETQTFEQKVTSIVSSATLDEAGNLVLPDDLQLDEATAFAVKTEKRRRDTQSAYSKAQQQLKVLSSANNQALELLEKEISVDLTTEEQTELEELKVANPEAWRQKVNGLDAKRKTKVESIRADITDKSAREVELATRQDQIKQYNLENPDHQLTDDVIDNDIPPRIVKKLEKGEITFEEFIEQSSSYLKKGKVINKGDEVDSEVDLSKAAGSSQIPEAARKASSSKDYKNETY